jgi:RNA polymerase sigma factor (sigma-70 family)
MPHAPAANADIDLLHRWAEGDQSAARELLRRHTAPLFRFFDRKVTGPVEDLVQETLLAAVEARDRFAAQGSFRAYLFGIARHVLYAHLRRRQRDAGELDVESSRMCDLAPSPSEIVARKKEDKLILQALRQLPLDTQVLFELHYWQGLTGPELAALYELPEPAIRSRLHRAKGRLRAIVEELAESPELVESTWGGFETWARGLPDVEPAPK